MPDLSITVTENGPLPLSWTSRGERWRPYRAYAVLHLWAQLSAGGPGTSAANPTSKRVRLAA